MPTANCSSTCWTITTAAGKSRSRPRSKVASAAGPPADEPIATSRAPCVSAIGMRNVPLVAARCSRPARIFAILSSIESSTSALPAPNAGVSIASSAPCPIASNTRCALVPTLAVTTRIAHGVAAMIRRVASTPSIRGISRSIKIRSGVFFAQSSTASAPSRAIQATSVPGRNSTVRRNASQINGRSFAIPTLMRSRLRSGPRPPAAACRRGSCLS
jgi:hypothetical protein